MLDEIKDKIENMGKNINFIFVKNSQSSSFWLRSLSSLSHFSLATLTTINNHTNQGNNTIYELNMECCEED